MKSDSIYICVEEKCGQPKRAISSIKEYHIHK